MSSKTAGRPAKRSEKATASESTSESTQPEGSTIKESPSSSISSPPSKFSSLAKFLTSPRRTEKSKQTKVKKLTKKSTKGKEKSKNVESKVEKNVSENTAVETSSKNLLCESGEATGDTSSVVTSPRRVAEGRQKEGEPSTPDRAKDKDNSKRPMIQTNLATGKDGIEVISSPEQQVEKKKGKKTSSKREASHEKGKKQTRLTNIFPVRKSNRKCKSEQEKDEQTRITKAILSEKFEGLEVRTIEGKGRGVFACRDFARNEFVCEYSGELISCDEAKKREMTYGEDKNVGCYMYYLKSNNKNYCVDATAEDGTFGRLLNHSKKGNCKTKVHVIEDIPHLILVTTRNIKQGEELTYDYGDRRKDALESHPWLKY